MKAVLSFFNAPQKILRGKYCWRASSNFTGHHVAKFATLALVRTQPLSVGPLAHRRPGVNVVLRPAATTRYAVAEACDRVSGGANSVTSTPLTACKPLKQLRFLWLPDAQGFIKLILVFEIINKLKNLMLIK